MLLIKQNFLINGANKLHKNAIFLLHIDQVFYLITVKLIKTQMVKLHFKTTKKLALAP